MGKSRFENVLTELYVIYDEIEMALAHLQEWSQPRPVTNNPLNQPASCYIMSEPLGVSLIIGLWNYPFQLTLAPLVAAIAAGCTAVVKPSELMPRCSQEISSLLRATFEPEYIAVVEGGIPETTELLEQKFDTIFFTGSVPVGKIVYQAAARHLTPVTLELGGKSPVIVVPDCDLDLTVKRLVWGKLLNAGQTCIAPDYVYVHESSENRFVEALRTEIHERAYKVENGNFVRIVNERNFERVVSMIMPEKVVIGGGSDLASRTVEPTVMTGVSWDDPVMQQEIFGPLLPVLSFQRLEEVIAEIKSRPKPLALYLFSSSQETKDKVPAEISFGGGCVNDTIMHISNGRMPFGGVGDSGMGSYHGQDGFRAFSHYKSILDKPFEAEPDIKYSPYTAEKIAVMESLLA